MIEQSPAIRGLFPIPVYIVKRDTNLTPREEKEIGRIVKEGMYKNYGNSTSSNSDIFNGKLKKIKQYCEQHIKIYVEQIINPKQELDFYITQSWLNITKPGGFHHVHNHSNSILSGVFYISTQEGDSICFIDPNADIKNTIVFEYKDWNKWNSVTTYFPVSEGKLVIFPSYLEHYVEPNLTQETRISISGNIRYEKI